jgi:hypothetical protein
MFDVQPSTEMKNKTIEKYLNRTEYNNTTARVPIHCAKSEQRDQMMQQKHRIMLAAGHVYRVVQEITERETKNIIVMR